MRTEELILTVGCLTACIALAAVPSYAGPLYAFTSDRDGENDIFVMEESGEVRNVTRVSFGDYPPYWGCVIPSWSPDGTRIAFSFNMKIDQRSEKELYVIDVDGTNMTRLTNSPGIDWYPSWSPDGSQIVFTSHRDGNSEVYVMNADGSDQHNLTLSPAYDSYAVWSPDGTQIAFQSDRTGVFQIYLMAPDGFDVRAVTVHPEYCGDPAWSPDGERLAFWTHEDIRIVELDGTQVARLDPGRRGFELDWSPDGRELAFGVLEGGEGNCCDHLFAISVETGAVRTLIAREANDLQLSWFPRAGSATLTRRSSWGTIKMLLR